MNESRPASGTGCPSQEAQAELFQGTFYVGTMARIGEVAIAVVTLAIVLVAAKAFLL